MSSRRKVCFCAPVTDLIRKFCCDPFPYTFIFRSSWLNFLFLKEEGERKTLKLFTQFTLRGEGRVVGKEPSAAQN